MIAAALVVRAGGAGPWHAGSVAALIAGVAGATAPDWLEIAWWTRARRLWITHRTATHWGIGWAIALVFAYRSLGHAHLWAAALFGFACGGVMHLLADWPNPLGVPWVWKRHSLNLWNSGHCDLIVVGCRGWRRLGLSDRIGRFMPRTLGDRCMHLLLLHQLLLPLLSDSQDVAREPCS